jgi:ERCC4-type nuclease
MYIVVDYREKELIKLLNAFGKEYKWWCHGGGDGGDGGDVNGGDHKIRMYVKNLPLGDVIIYDGELDDKSPTSLDMNLGGRNELIIIERKTLPDLAASIRDGRYQEQSLRLEHTSLHNHNIIYLIEGKMEFYRSNYSKIDSKTLYSSMFSMLYYKGFSVFRTQSLVETRNVILYFIDKLYREKVGKFKVPYYDIATTAYDSTVATVEDHGGDHGSGAGGDGGDGSDSSDKINKKYTNVKLKKEFVNEKGQELGLGMIPEIKTHQYMKHYSEQNDYSQVISKVKKSNITPDNIGEIMLSQIPGISSTLSKAILSHFGSISVLIDRMREDDTCLDKVTYMSHNSKTNQVRYLTIKCKKSLKKYLVGVT